MFILLLKDQVLFILITFAYSILSDLGTNKILHSAMM